MKLILLSIVTLAGLTSLSTSQPLPDTTNGNSNTNVVPVRWNDVEAGVHAAQSSAYASASASASLNARKVASEPELGLRPYGSKSGAEAGGHRGGSGLWGRSPGPKKKHESRNGKPGKQIEGANPFDEGGDHKGDPSWG